MKTMTQFNKKRRAQSNEIETKHYMFGKMIVSELKKFPENLKFLLKRDINQVIYNYKLNQYNTMTPPMSATTVDSSHAVASPISDSGKPLRSPLMELSSGKSFQPL